LCHKSMSCNEFQFQLEIHDSQCPARMTLSNAHYIARPPVAPVVQQRSLYGNNKMLAPPAKNLRSHSPASLRSHSPASFLRSLRGGQGGKEIHVPPRHGHSPASYNGALVPNSITMSNTYEHEKLSESSLSHEAEQEWLRGGTR